MESLESGKRDEKESECDGEVAEGDEDDATTTVPRCGHKTGQTFVSRDPKGNGSSSSQMLGLLDEFTKIYSDRLQRVEETAMKSNEKQYLDRKVCVLESWVRDLGEQNAVLVATVEELEKEAADRVALLEDRLSKMATTTRESCVSLRDHQIQVSSLVADKMGLEKEAHGLGDKVVSLERSNFRLKEENNNLQSDLNNLVQVISRARVTGQWEADDLTFSCVTPEQVFGPVLSSSRRSSQSLKDSQRDYIHQMLEDHLKKDNSSVRSSLSNLQDADSSIYGSRGSDKEVLIMKLKADLRCSQTANEEINCQLIERDKQIADLQAQLTEIHHELAESQAEVNSVTHALQELRHHNRHESVEISRKEDVIRQLLCKTSKKDSVKGSFPSLCDLDSAGTGENNLEAQLSDNIDILASRLAELEEECQQLRDQHSSLQDTHALCAPTITMLQDQLSRSQQIDSIDKGAMTEQSLVSLSNGFYSPSSTQLTQASKLQNEVENKSEMLEKMESENSSLTKMLNEKSSNLERFQNEVLKISSELDKRKKEVADQRLTINTLQDALVTSKRTCDELRLRLDNDVTSRESETDRLEQDLNVAQTLHHQTFTQLVESDARSEVLHEENRALSRRVVALQEDLKHTHSQDTRQSERISRERDQLRRQLQEAERRCQELVTSVQLLQGQVQTLEEEVTTATEARSDAERQAEEAQRKNLHLQESLSAQETSESVERLGRQLEDTVAALTKAREEALSKTEQLRQAKQDVTQLSDALSYEKELNTNLHDQMESLVKIAGTQEHKSAEHQQELRKIIRDAMQKDRQISTLEAQVEGLKSQIGALEELVTIEQKEVTSLNEALSSETKLLCQTRTKLDAARKEAVRGEEQVSSLRKDLQHSQDKISRQEQRIKEMENQHETEVAAVAERLTAAHEASVRRLEDTLLTYTRLQAQDEFQVENLEESLRDVGGRLAESELRVKELEREREALNRSLHQEQTRRDEDSQEHQRQLMRLTEETTLLKARLEGVQEETLTWQRQCEDLEERHQHSDGNNNLHTQLLKTQHQVESLRDAMLTAKLETRTAEEERSHAHEQVLSLIRECNALEEQIHRLTKEKCRLQDQLSSKESDITLLERENATASSKEELAHSAERIAQLEKELSLAKNGKGVSEVTFGGEEVRTLRQQLKEAQMEVQRLKGSKDDKEAENTTRSERKVILQEEVTTLTKQLREAHHRETQLTDQLHIQNLGMYGGGELLLSDLRSEIAAARRESSEARRMLLERESQGRMAQLKVNTLQKMLQDRQQEVSELEERLTESQMETHRAETDITHLRARVATLTTQLGHAQAHGKTTDSTHAFSHSDKVESLENEVSRLKGDLAAKVEELNQMCDKDNRSIAKIHDLEQDVARITKVRDEAHRNVVSLEGSLAESLEASEATKTMKKLWEGQLANIQQEMSRLLCETTQLKECNVALHEQLSASQNEGEHLRGEIRTKDAQVDELQHARDLLANDAQVVVAAVKQWLHEQKTTNTKLAGKLHQQNKHILLLNTEKQFLAERNTNLQRVNHELSLQLHDLRVRLGLPLTSSPEKIGKTGVMSGVGGFGSPRVLSPSLGGGGGGGGGSSRVVSTTPPLDMFLGPSIDSVFGHSIFNDKLEDGFSTCSSEGSSGGGCHVPGPDLPGSLQLERLAHLADSLLLASRNITRSSSLMQGIKYSKMTSATSLGDLTSGSSFSHLRSTLGPTKRTSSSVGNLSLLSPIDLKDKPGSPNSRFSYRFTDQANFLSSGSKVNGKLGEVILVPPVRERKTSHRYLQNHSIEEAEEEDGSTSGHCDTDPRNQMPSEGRTRTPPQLFPSSVSHHIRSLPISLTPEITRTSQTAQGTQTIETAQRTSVEESAA